MLCFNKRKPVVCREIFAKSVRPDYSWEVEIGASQLGGQRTSKFPADADVMWYRALVTAAILRDMVSDITSIYSYTYGNIYV